jgi:hypothetical protein
MGLALAAIALFLHGLVHLVGFFVPWRYADIDAIGPENLLLDRIPVSMWMARALGLAWLAVTVAYLVAAVAIVIGAPWTVGLIIATTLVSLVLCLLKLPDMLFGVIADILILAIVAHGVVTGWLVFL